MDTVQDRLEHYHMFDYRARCAFAVTTETTREAQKRHGLDPLTTIALGRAIGCVALLASTLKKGDEYIHATFQSEALIRRLVAECNGFGHCRGYVSPPRIEQAMQQRSQARPRAGRCRPRHARDQPPAEQQRRRQERRAEQPGRAPAGSLHDRCGQQPERDAALSRS